MRPRASSSWLLQPQKERERESYLSTREGGRKKMFMLSVCVDRRGEGEERGTTEPGERAANGHSETSSSLSPSHSLHAYAHFQVLYTGHYQNDCCSCWRQQQQQQQQLLPFVVWSTQRQSSSSSSLTRIVNIRGRRRRRRKRRRKGYISSRIAGVVGSGLNSLY